LVSTDEMLDLDERVAVIREGLAIAQRLDDPALQYMAYELLSIVFQTSRQEQRYRETCEQALGLLERLPSRRQQVDLLVSVSGARADAGLFESALEAAEDAFARSAELSPHERMHAAWEIYRAAEPLGKWDRVVELLPWYAEAAAAEGDITCASVRGGPPLGGTVIARRGQTAWADEMVPVAGQTGRAGTFGSAALAARYAAAMRRSEADDLVTEALARTGSGFLATGAAPMLDALVELGRYDDLAGFLPVSREQANANEMVAPTVARAESVLAIRRGEREAAVTLLRTALVGFEKLEVPFEIARTQQTLAELIAPPEREQLMRAALAGFERLDAAPDAQRVRRALEATAYGPRVGAGSDGESASNSSSAGK
jgi:hypothetical protein